MSEWQDFNTAPRDNTTILAASPKRADIVTVAWDVKASEWRSNVYPYLTFDGQFFTHWQPSPELTRGQCERGTAAETGEVGWR